MPELAEPESANVPDYYALFGLSLPRTADEEISSVELKQAYKRALLIYHPDKKVASRSHLSAAGDVTVDYITSAYQTLTDPIKRVQYDERLRTDKAVRDRDGTRTSGHHTGIEIVDLEDLDVDDDTGTWSRTCRCGSLPAYVVTEAQLEEHAADGEVTVGCKGCSLWLRVLYTIED